jgi:hypothetical protein
VQKKSQNASGQAGAFRTAMTAPLDAAQMQAFEDDGAVLVDLRLSSDLLDRAEAAWDRLAKAGTSTPHSILEDRDFVELISAPVFEEIAKQVLRSDRVFILETGAAGTGLERAEAKERALREDWPEKHGIRSEWANSMHIDVQVTTEDFEAMPRREHLAIWFWLNNVPAERAAMRVLKGSHKPLGAHWQEIQRRWKANPARAAAGAARAALGGRGRARRPLVCGVGAHRDGLSPRLRPSLLAVSSPRWLAFRRHRAAQGIPHLVGRRRSEHWGDALQ